MTEDGAHYYTGTHDQVRGLRIRIKSNHTKEQRDLIPYWFDASLSDNSSRSEELIGPDDTGSFAFFLRTDCVRRLRQFAEHTGLQVQGRWVNRSQASNPFEESMTFAPRGTSRAELVEYARTYPK